MSDERTNITEAEPQGAAVAMSSSDTLTSHFWQNMLNHARQSENAQVQLEGICYNYRLFIQ